MTAISKMVEDVPPSVAIRALFIASSAFVLFVAGLPAKARDLMLEYGARSSSARSREGSVEEKAPGTGKSSTHLDKFTSFVAALTSYGQVPHGWFNHFYYVSTSSSLFWLYQYLADGVLLKTIAQSEARHGGSSTTQSQLISAWIIMFLQAARRLYEDTFIKKASKSKMWFVHWVVGLGFYAGMSMAVWIEGSRTLLDSLPGGFSTFKNIDGATRLKLILGISTCVYGWMEQNACHRHLASLKKYSLPTRGSFNKLVCPHYTAECLIYLGMAVAAAPSGQIVNKTLLCALIFVAVNLGVTANGTKKWYEGKFGEDSMRGKWKMIPGIF